MESDFKFPQWHDHATHGNGYKNGQKYYCKCNTGWDFNDETGTCSIEVCNPNPCPLGGTCNPVSLYELFHYYEDGQYENDWDGIIDYYGLFECVNQDGETYD